MEDEDDKTCKVLIIGEENVGKESIRIRFVEGVFREQEMMIGSSTHEEIPSKRIIVDEKEGKSVKFEIWTPSGQERYHALTHIFYRNAGIVILVYDITRKESFEEIKKYWYNEIKEQCKKNISR